MYGELFNQEVKIKYTRINFIEKAEKIYTASPQKFGFAFWKYRELLKDAQIFDEAIDQITYMYAINDNRLIYYWSEDENLIIPRDELSKFDLIYIHSKYKNSLRHLEGSHDINLGNALIYNSNYQKDIDNDSFYVETVDFNESRLFKIIADIINNSSFGTDIFLSPDYIQKLIFLPVFDPNFWILVFEKQSKTPVAAGICIYDSKIKETEIEWLYVHKEYHGLGIGRMLINEIIRKAKDKSNLIRVGGVADEFYIKCGFGLKTDEWMWIKRKGSNAGWWE